MSNTFSAPRGLMVLCGAVLLAWGAAHAQTSATPTPAPVVAKPSPPKDKLVAQYTAWAGSQQNAQALVLGLRSGSAVSLGTGATSATFTPTTTKLGTGEVNIALSLAKAALTKQGITNPTPAQIAAALNGGVVTTATGTQSMPGVLAQRQSGMGWGQIAHTMGVKLGSIVSASKTGKEHAANDDHAKASHTGSAGKPHASDAGSASHGNSGHSGGNSGGGGSGGGKSK